MSHDQKLMTLLPPNLITTDKEIFQSHERGLPAIQIDVSGFSMAKDSQTGKFVDFEQFKIKVVLLTLGKSKVTLIVHLY